MERKITWFYHILLAVGLVLGLVATFMVKNNMSREATNENARILSDYMIATRADNSISYVGKLPDKDVQGNEVAFYASHSIVEVYVGEKLVYRVTPPRNSIFHTVGYTWNRVPMREVYKGLPIKVKATSVYQNKAAEMTIYYGSFLGIAKKCLRQEGISLAIGFGTLLVGIMLLVAAIIMLSGGVVDYSMTHLSIFSILLGGWLTLDSRLVACVITYPHMLALMTHIFLMLMPIPFMLFLRTIFVDYEKMIEWFCWGNCGIVILRLGLQLIGLYDVRQTIFMTHTSILIMVLLVAYMAMKEVRNNKVSREFNISLLCLFIILLTAVVDIIYYSKHKTSSSFTSLSVFFYSVIMAFYTVQRSRKIRERQNETELYRKLAFVDELTGLYNRTAFQQDLLAQEQVDAITAKKKVKPTTILMFDLNELKKCNDQFGHEFGDAYINMVAKEIYNVFGLEGKCYRVGGDEFCAILPTEKESHVENLVTYFLYRVNLLNKTPFVVYIQAAVGYAVYQQEDTSLEETKNRADKMMYENKEKQKREIK